MADPKTICTVGKFSVLYPKDGGTPTLSFRVHYAAPYGVDFLQAGFRLKDGKLDNPSIRLGGKKLFKTFYCSRRVALDIYDALLRAVESGDWPEEIAPPGEDIEEVISSLLYDNQKAAEMLGMVKKSVVVKKEITYEPYKYRA